MLVFEWIKQKNILKKSTERKHKGHEELLT